MDDSELIPGTLFSFKTNRVNWYFWKDSGHDLFMLLNFINPKNVVELKNNDDSTFFAERAPLKTVTGALYTCPSYVGINASLTAYDRCTPGLILIKLSPNTEPDRRFVYINLTDFKKFFGQKFPFSGDPK
jgi:hypothetical protein